MVADTEPDFRLISIPTYFSCSRLWLCSIQNPAAAFGFLHCEQHPGSATGSSFREKLPLPPLGSHSQAPHLTWSWNSEGLGGAKGKIWAFDEFTFCALKSQQIAKIIVEVISAIASSNYFLFPEQFKWIYSRLSSVLGLFLDAGLGHVWFILYPQTSSRAPILIFFLKTQIKTSSLVLPCHYLSLMGTVDTNISPLTGAKPAMIYSQLTQTGRVLTNLSIHLNSWYKIKLQTRSEHAKKAVPDLWWRSQCSKTTKTTRIMIFLLFKWQTNPSLDFSVLRTATTWERRANLALLLLNSGNFSSYFERKNITVHKAWPFC